MNVVVGQLYVEHSAKDRRSTIVDRSNTCIQVILCRFVEYFVFEKDAFHMYVSIGYPVTDFVNMPFGVTTPCETTSPSYSSSAPAARPHEQ